MLRAWEYGVDDGPDVWPPRGSEIFGRVCHTIDPIALSASPASPTPQQSSSRKGARTRGEPLHDG